MVKSWSWCGPINHPFAPNEAFRFLKIQTMLRHGFFLMTMLNKYKQDTSPSHPTIISDTFQLLKTLSQYQSLKPKLVGLITWPSVRKHLFLFSMFLFENRFQIQTFNLKTSDFFLSVCWTQQLSISMAESRNNPPSPPPPPPPPHHSPLTP